MLAHDPAFGFHSIHISHKRHKKHKTILRLARRVHSSLLCFLCLLWQLFSKPSIGVEEFYSDAPVAINVVNPGAVYFSIQLTTKRWHQLYLRTKGNINVDKKRGAAAADFNGLGLGCKSLA